MGKIDALLQRERTERHVNVMRSETAVMHVYSKGSETTVTDVTAV